MNLSNKIGLEIFSGLTEPETGLPKPKGFTWGATLRRAGEVRMGIALELLEPMMNGGLSPAELKLEIFRVTITLLHETAVRYHTHYPDRLCWAASKISEMQRTNKYIARDLDGYIRSTSKCER